MTNPLVDDCITSLNLTLEQARGALGLVLKQLQKRLSDVDFKTLEATLPNTREILAQAPETRHTFLSGLAGPLGGDKGKLLVDLRQGLQDLDIPTDLHRPLADTLKTSFETHYPELQSLVEKVQI
ncbi:MAG: DUF2780 domain-containing protein [Kiritimatiellae bacterium]|jgi:hypothetical protein|nr:DUF2780 domain-containing protein [Kiritimatiellia bacterium]